MKRIALGTLFFGLAIAAACGGGGGGSPPPPGPAQVSTLAYVVTRCHEEKGVTGYSGSQALWIQRGDRGPVKIVELVGGQPPIGGFCQLWANGRDGTSSTVVGAFQRLGVSPDGSLVVFEVTDDFSVSTHLVPPEQKGFFAVRADGSGLHRVADHSNDPAFRIDWGCALKNTPACKWGEYWTGLEFSPDGRRIVYTDLGPSDSGEEAPQVFTLDLTTNEHQQVTFLPPLPKCRGQSDDPPACIQPTTFPVYAPSFLDETTVNYTRGRGSNSAGGGAFAVKLNPDGTPQEEPQAVEVVAGPNGAVIPVFEITGADAYAVRSAMPGRMPVDGGEFVFEMFVVELPNAQRPELRVLQLTNFGRSDLGQGRITPDSQRVLFVTGANPFGANPGNQLQWFSIDRLGSDLRQLTSFGAVGEGGSNCGNLGPGGTILPQSRLDLRAGSLVFSSSCDPLGTNPWGGNQLFAMRPDGSGLRQLTYTQGIVNHPDRSIDVELPGPYYVPSRLR